MNFLHSISKRPSIRVETKKNITMKRSIIILAILLGLISIRVQAQTSTPPKNTTPTSIGIIIYSNDIETIWNAMRIAAYSKTQGDTVTVFLLGKGVEVEILAKKNKDLKEEVNKFIDNGGFVLGSGVCLASRNDKEPQLCKLSSIGDLYMLIRKSKIVLSF